MSGHLDGPPPGPPDPPYIPGDLGAPSAEEFARRRASSEPRPDLPPDREHDCDEDGETPCSAFNEAVERRASGYEQRIAALDDLVQRAWSLIAGAMSGNPHKPIANSEWMDAAHAWEIDYCMGARYAAATPDPPTRTGNVPQVPVVFASNDDDSREAWKAAAEAEAEAGDEARREVARLRALLAASPDQPKDRFAPPGDADRVTHEARPAGFWWR